MRVQRIKISNIMGLEELDFEPGRLTVISGQNGRGKTSVMEAIRSALGGGHDATLLRNGAKSGEVVLVLDDGIEITKRIRPHHSDVDVRHPELGKVSKPQTWLNGIADALAFNPVAFITAPAKKRAEWLLEAVPLDAEEVADAVAEAVKDVAMVQGAEVSGHGLEVIERVRRRLYDTRTSVNGEVKKARATAEQLAASLPNTDTDADEIRDMIGKETAKLRELQSLRSAQEARIRQVANKEVEAIHVDYGARIAALQEQIRELERERAERIQRIREDATAKIAVANEELHHKDAEITATLATLHAQLDEASRTANTRAVIERMRAEAKEAEARSDALTAALERLDALKIKLLANLPLPDGVEVRDGEVYVNGVPFDRVNRAQQVAVAMAVAKMRTGKLGLVVMDGLECLDADTFEAFRAWVERSEGLQLVVTRVSDTPLAVEVLA